MTPQQAKNEAGLCARTVCPNPHDNLRHVDNRDLYCGRCRERINFWVPGRDLFVKEGG